MTRRVMVLNPVGATLAHYARETRAVLEAGGAQVDVLSTLEPSASGSGRINWVLRAYAHVIRAAFSRKATVVLVWPVLGYIDAVFMNLVIGHRGVVVVHDPVPLVRALGYGRAATALARRLRRVTLLVHSAEAQIALTGQGFTMPRLVPHPILPTSSPTQRGAEDNRISVVVTGQFKKDRDLALMEGIARLGEDQADFHVHGRGWPAVAGWEVEDRFLTEEELDQVIASADAVLIPYKRFYQSGVAIRALELRTPVVGPKNSSLATMFVRCSENLAETNGPAEWWACARKAATTSAADLDRDLTTYARLVAEGWAELLAFERTMKGFAAPSTVRVQVGKIDPHASDDWLSTGLVTSVVAWPWGAPSGRRWGRRSLGLGVDAIAAALLGLVRQPRSRFLAANPWIGAALRLVGREVLVTGIYAVPGTRSWRLLRLALGNSPVVTLSEVEADNWRKDGGRAVSVRYGATFGYPMRRVRTTGEPVRVFVGGASDRDLILLAGVIEEAERLNADMEFVLCVGKAALPTRIDGLARVERHGALSQAEFGRLIGTSDVVFLPLEDTNRAAGHMVAVGALEAGVPVVASSTAGMHGYFDLLGVHEVDGDGIVTQLASVGLEGRHLASALHDGWSANVSRRAYAHRVAHAFDLLGS